MSTKLPLIILLLLFFYNTTSSAFASELKINEIFVHPSSGSEWVEFYNPENIDLTTYFFDDDLDFNSDAGSSAKKSLAAINNSNLLYPYFECSSFLNNSGDYAVLFASDGQVIDQYKYEEDPGIDISIGRSPNGSGEMEILIEATRGFENSVPPTSTPTLTPSPTPTKTPTKTPTPIPTKAPTPTKKIASTNTPTPIAKNATASLISSSNSSLLDTRVLGESSASSKASSEPRLNDEVNDRNINLGLIFSVAGSIFIVICGILWFLIYKKKIFNKNEE